MLTDLDGKDPSVPDVDFNPRCESKARLSVKDLNGPFAYAVEEHEDTERYPGVKVAVCDLAAGHAGNCEAFVDGTGAMNGEPYEGHWMTWQKPATSNELQRDYEWIVRPEGCQEVSPSLPEQGCNRYADHAGGHAFHAFIA
ncbi:hypothetical protein ACQEVZ_60750 [Dactylosporangium sp. CA-152071]|uniref:hypothetical protein n=1 Tax=Dactylosporangium sp. CA-152071 TaxID=3239933 RepID=UPI003D8FA00B